MRIFHTGSWRIGSNLFLYAVTEYAGENLSQILPERALTTAETREMLDPVLDALDYLHKSGFTHGHLKPSNIMVVDDQLKISSENLQLSGRPVSIAASPDVYCAPEDAAGVSSPSADIWSLGVLLVETLTQHPPVWERSTHQEPVVPESVPQPFAAIARECLRTDPQRRCAIGEIKARLEAPTSLPEPAAKSVSKVLAKQGLTAIVAAALALLIIVSALLLRSHKPRSSRPVEERQTVTSPAAPTHPSHATKKPSSKATAGKRNRRGQSGFARCAPSCEEHDSRNDSCDYPRHRRSQRRGFRCNDRLSGK